MQKKLFTLVLAIIMALGLSAVAETADTAATAATPDASTVMATINGEDITLGDVSGAYQYLSQMYQAQGVDVTSADVQNFLSSYALNMIVQEKVIFSKAKELGLDKLSDEQAAEIQAKAEETYENTLTSYKSYFASAGLTEEQVRANTEEYFKSQGYSVDSVASSLKSTATYENVHNYAIKDVTVTDEDVQKAYDDGLKAAQESYPADPAAYESDVASGKTILYVPEGYRNVKHILIKVADAKELKQLKEELKTLSAEDEKYQTTVDRIAEIMKDVQPKLDEISAKIAAGEDFQSLIDQYGEDGGMKVGSGAANGYAMSAGSSRYVTEFTSAGMALEKIGDISEPVLSDFGFHIIRYESDVPARVVPFEEIKEQLAQSLKTERESAAYQNLVTGWIADADIVYAQPETETETEPAEGEAKAE